MHAVSSFDLKFPGSTSENVWSNSNNCYIQKRELRPHNWHVLCGVIIVNIYILCIRFTPFYLYLIYQWHYHYWYIGIDVPFINNHRKLLILYNHHIWVLSSFVYAALSVPSTLLEPGKMITGSGAVWVFFWKDTHIGCTRICENSRTKVSRKETVTIAITHSETVETKCSEYPWKLRKHWIQQYNFITFDSYENIYKYSLTCPFGSIVSLSPISLDLYTRRSNISHSTMNRLEWSNI